MFIAVAGYAQQFTNDRIYKSYLKIQEATTDGKFAEALEGINKLADYKTVPIETAAIQRARGFILLNLDREPEAAEAFKIALAQGELNNFMTQEMKYIIANLHAGESQWEEAFNVYKEWLDNALAYQAQYEQTQNEDYNVTQPDSDSYRLGAAIAASVNNFPYAIARTEDAIKVIPQPEKELYALLVALHYQSKDLKSAVASIQRGLSIFPDHQEFWKNLSSLYQLIKEDPSALAALVIAYEEGMLQSEEEYLLLGRYFIYRGVPFDGARVISRGLNEKVVEPTFVNLELLSQAWFAAREFDESLEILKLIVSQYGDIEACLRACQILLEDEEYDKVLSLLTKAEPGNRPADQGMYFKLKGYAEYGKGDYTYALESFRLAGKSDPELAESSQSWCEYIEDEFIK